MFLSLMFSRLTTANQKYTPYFFSTSLCQLLGTLFRHGHVLHSNMAKTFLTQFQRSRWLEILLRVVSVRATYSSTILSAWRRASFYQLPSFTIYHHLPVCVRHCDSCSAQDEDVAHTTNSASWCREISFGGGQGLRSMKPSWTARRTEEVCHRSIE